MRLKKAVVPLLFQGVVSAGVVTPLYNCQYTGNISQSEIIEDCPYCFASWEEDNSTGLIEESSITRGCFNYNGPRDAAEECQSSKCLHVLLEGDEGGLNERFCCCTGDGCNADFSSMKELDFLILLKEQQHVGIEEGRSDVSRNRLLYMGICLSTVLLIFGLLLAVVLDAVRRGKRKDVRKLLPAEGNARLSVRLERAIEAEHCLCLGSGNFGSAIYNAYSSGEGSKSCRISVKVFNGLQKQAYVNERELYEAIQTSDSGCKSAFLQFFGSKDYIQFTDGSTFNHSIILEQSQLGFLDDFLRQNAVSWTALCRMLTSISRCLSLMHSGFASKSRSFVHRNLNSHNILVRSDLSCSVCNFEHAALVDDGKHKVLPPPPEECNPRYMSPEILEDPSGGAVSLKQADVYSLGLLFWEVTRRCDDLYQGVPVPPFQLAFQNELGRPNAKPTWDGMKILVSRRRARPLFPEVWKNSNPAVQQIRETIEDCWDHDGEARLTAFCALERCRDLAALMDKYTKRYNHVRGPSNNLRTLERKISPINMESNDLSGPVAKNNNVLSRQCPPLQIQPHQGRNPCAERNNLHRGDPGDDPVVFRSSKDKTARTSNVGDVDPAPVRVPRVRTPRVTRPIEYLQNDFRSGDGGSAAASGLLEDRQSALKQSAFSKNSDGSKSSLLQPSPKFNNVESDPERAGLLVSSNENAARQASLSP